MHESNACEPQVLPLNRLASGLFIDYMFPDKPDKGYDSRRLRSFEDGGWEHLFYFPEEPTYLPTIQGCKPLLHLTYSQREGAIGCNGTVVSVTHIAWMPQSQVKQLSINANKAAIVWMCLRLFALFACLLVCWFAC